MLMGQAILLAFSGVSALAALAFEVWLRMRKPLKRWPLSYAAWTLVALLLIAGLGWDQGPGRALAMALLLGPIAYPLTLGCFWLRFGRLDPIDWPDSAAAFQRLEHRATDFGRVAKPAPQFDAAAIARANYGAMTAPILVSPARSAPGRVSKPGRARWEGPTELVVLTLGSLVIGAAVSACFAVEYRRDPSGFHPVTDYEIVAADLEAKGFAAPGVQLDRDQLYCSGHIYRWRAIGAVGRACVETDGYVSTWVEQSWFPIRPTARPAVAAPEAVTPPGPGPLRPGHRRS